MSVSEKLKELDATPMSPQERECHLGFLLGSALPQIVALAEVAENPTSGHGDFVRVLADLEEALS